MYRSGSCSIQKTKELWCIYLPLRVLLKLASLQVGLRGLGKTEKCVTAREKKKELERTVLEEELLL